MAKKNHEESAVPKATDEEAETGRSDIDLEDTSKFRVDPAAMQAAATAEECTDEFEDTGEFPALTAASLSEAAQKSVWQETSPQETPADERASYLLNHLEGEIQQLHAKWESVGDMLRLRETRIDELLGEVRERDAVVDELRREIAEHAVGKQAVQAELEQARERIVGLDEARTARDVELEQARADLRDLEIKLAAADETIDDLTAGVERGRQEAAGLARQHDDQVAANNELRVRIQELESYVDSRKSTWTALQEKVAEHERKVTDLQRSEAAKNVQLADRVKENERLEASVQELDRKRETLEQRCKSHETAYEEIEAQLRTQAAIAARLRAELDDTSNAAAETVARLVHRDERVASLESTLAERDQAIADLNESLEKQQHTESDLRTHRDTLAARVSELEALATERLEIMQRLQESGEIAEKALRGSEERLAKLERESEARAKKVGGLRDALATQEELIGRLESDLSAKQRALDLLERNVKRLDDLGASVAGLDREFSSPPAEILGASLRPLPAGDKSIRPPLIEISSPPPSPALCRKMLVGVDGDERARYLLHKDKTTIGRAAENDIRIRSPFISRVHACIIACGPETLIEDLGSKNGLAVNLVPVQEQVALSDGDVINFGGSLNLMYVELDRPKRADQAEAESSESSNLPDAR